MNMSNQKVYTEGNVLVIERIFNAPRNLVFKAYSESDRLEQWWGPEGWKTENFQFEFKPDGVWHYCMTCLDKNQGEYYGQESCGKGIFQEIVAPEKIAYIDYFADKAGNVNEEMPGMRVTLTFTEQDGKTLIITRSEFASEEDLKQVMEMGVVEGFSSQMNRLDELLAEQLKMQ